MKGNFLAAILDVDTLLKKSFLEMAEMQFVKDTTFLKLEWIIRRAASYTTGFGFLSASVDEGYAFIELKTFRSVSCAEFTFTK